MVRSRQFAQDEQGSSTTDWVVLAGLIVGVMIAVTAAMQTETADQGERIGTTLVESAAPGHRVGSGGHGAE